MKKQFQYPAPKKRLGQNFLVDQGVLQAIVEIIKPDHSETIVEIGPGRGALTEKLLQTGARIIGVEFDRDLIPVLGQKFSRSSNFQLIQEDILRHTPILKKDSFKLVGNIPYNLTTKLFEKILLWPEKPSSMTFLVQKEVGEKIVQKGNKNSPLAVCITMLGETRIMLQVPPKSFAPPPNVNSVVIHIDGSQRKDLPDPWELYDFAHKVFRMPRKTLWNNLISFIDREQVKDLFMTLAWDPLIRPEKLSFEDILKLYTCLSMYSPSNS